MRRSLNIVVLGAGLIVTSTMLASCADGPDAPSAELKPQQVSRVYRLGVGDKVKLSVYGENDLSGSFEVDALGNVALPLIGEMPAKGRPIGEFRDNVARKLSNGYLINPRVAVEVINYRPIFVHGEVRNGGEFPFKNGLKLRDAIAVAGGYTYRANKNHVLLTREGEVEEVRVALPTDLDVLPGDNIRIPERFF
jgi:polysaccharide export outer membrane protein